MKQHNRKTLKRSHHRLMTKRKALRKAFPGLTNLWQHVSFHDWKNNLKNPL